MSKRDADVDCHSALEDTLAWAKARPYFYHAGYCISDMRCPGTFFVENVRYPTPFEQILCDNTM